MTNKKGIRLLFFICTICFIFSISVTKVESDTEELKNIYNNRWSQKSWLTLGDSITKANGYQPIVKEKLGFLKIDNKGINGQTMAYQKTNKSTYYIGKDINYKQYDLVTIFIGTNDFRYNKKLGKLSNNNEYDQATFIGAYQLLIEKILKSNKDIDLVLITPLQRSKDGYDINFTNEAGYKLIDYVNAIKDLGKKYSLPVLDLYSNSGFTNNTLSVYTRDNLHPNEKGYKIIAQKMYSFLLNL